MICKNCGDEFKIHQMIDGKDRNMHNRKYCLECSPFLKHNTTRIHIHDTATEKECRNCHIIKPLEEFYTRKGRSRRFSSWCRQCSNEENVIRLKRNKKQAVEYKGGECERCGFDKCVEALDFHHINPEEKDVDFRRMRGWSEKRRNKELDKCILLCANCHREEHSKKEEIPADIAKVVTARV